MDRRGFGAALMATALPIAWRQTHAQDFPSKAVRLVVPFAPGGVLDVSTRALAVPLAQELGQQVVVENRAGAGGNIGTEVVARAAPDGYTLLMITDTNAIAPALYEKLSYDPIADLLPVTLLASGPHVLVAHPSVPVSDVRALVAYAKANPNTLSYATPGSGTAQHMAGELFKSGAGGLMITHVPYKGGGQAIVDVVGGQVPLAVLGLAPALAHIKGGRLKALGVTGRARAAVLSDVPTLAESKVAGLEAFETTQWLGLAAPAGTPAAIVRRLHASAVKSISVSAVESRLKDIGLAVTVSESPAAFSDFYRGEIARWAPLVKAVGAKVV
jgi:tripartite-type tricarboxylate transporter receptor subunit TctC